MASREYHDGGLLSAVVGSMMASIAMGGRREERDDSARIDGVGFEGDFQGLKDEVFSYCY